MPTEDAAAWFRREAGFDGALGHTLIASGRTNQGFSRATSDAADNLLTKALRRLAAGDDDRARAFVRRALQLPYDEHEEMDPAPWSVHMMLYLSLTADLEASPVGDLGWLDRATDVCEAAAPPADDEVRAALASLLADHQLSHTEVRRVRALAPGVPRDVEPLAAVATADEEVRCTAVMAVLGAVGHHRGLVAAARG